MKILHLTLKKQWFDLIANGTKKEEYRDIKPHWNRILSKQKYDAIQFVNGYGKHRPHIIIELKEILSGLGIVEWGAPENKTVYILKLGRILKIDNYDEARAD